MGKKPRHKPARLAEKLLEIRTRMGLSQSEIYRKLNIEKYAEVKRISDYETGKTEPPLIVLLQYARLAGISTDVLIDDKKSLRKK